jgi:hypothetical protein
VFAHNTTIIQGHSHFANYVQSNSFALLYQKLILSGQKADIEHLTEESIAQPDGNGLDLVIVLKSSLSKLATDTRALEATEWKGPV